MMARVAAGKCGVSGLIGSEMDVLVVAEPGEIGSGHGLPTDWRSRGGGEGNRWSGVCRKMGGGGGGLEGCGGSWDQGEWEEWVEMRGGGLVCVCARGPRSRSQS